MISPGFLFSQIREIPGNFLVPVPEKIPHPAPVFCSADTFRDLHQRIFCCRVPFRVGIQDITNPPLEIFTGRRFLVWADTSPRNYVGIEIDFRSRYGNKWCDNRKECPLLIPKETLRISFEDAYEKYACSIIKASAYCDFCYTMPARNFLKGWRCPRESSGLRIHIPGSFVQTIDPVIFNKPLQIPCGVSPLSRIPHKQCRNPDISPVCHQPGKEMEESRTLLVPGQEDPDVVSGPEPVMRPYVTLCLCFDIEEKVVPAEMHAGVGLEDEGIPCAFGALHRFVPVKLWKITDV